MKRTSSADAASDEDVKKAALDKITALREKALKTEDWSDIIRRMKKN